MSNLPVRDPSERPQSIATPPSDESTRSLIAAIPFPVRKRDFFRAWLALAFFHAWGRQDAVAGLIGLVFPVISNFIPAWGSAITDLAWQIPLTVLATVFVMRLALSPYWLFRERSAALEQEQAKNTRPAFVGRVIEICDEWWLCQLDLAHFDGLIWPPSLPFLLVRPERRPNGGAEAGTSAHARQQSRFCSGFHVFCFDLYPAGGAVVTVENSTFLVEFPSAVGTEEKRTWFFLRSHSAAVSIARGFLPLQTHFGRLPLSLSGCFAALLLR